MSVADRMEGEHIRTSSRYFLGKLIISMKMLTDALGKKKKKACSVLINRQKKVFSSINYRIHTIAL